MTEGREIERQALMVEFEALKVEAMGQEMSDRLDLDGATVMTASQSKRRYTEIAGGMRDVAKRLREL